MNSGGFLTNMLNQNLNIFGSASQEIRYHEHNFTMAYLNSVLCCLCNISQSGNFSQCLPCALNICPNCTQIMRSSTPNLSVHGCALNLRPRNGWKCDMCKRSSPSQAAFNCKTHDFDACFFCYLPTSGQPQPQGPPRRVAGHDHELSACSAAPGECRNCNNGAMKQGYRCNSCAGFLLCVDCLNTVEMYGTRSSVHGCDLKLQVRNSSKCDNCKNSIGKGNIAFKCPNHDFDVCIKCMSQTTVLRNPRSTFSHEHQQLSLSLLLPGECRSCRAQAQKPGYRCEQCEFIVCGKCLDELEALGVRSMSHSCEMKLRVRNGWKCDKCGNKPGNGVIAFGCKQHDFDLCTKCMKETSMGQPGGMNPQPGQGGQWGPQGGQGGQWGPQGGQGGQWGPQGGQGQWGPQPGQGQWGAPHGQWGPQPGQGQWGPQPGQWGPHQGPYGPNPGQQQQGQWGMPQVQNTGYSPEQNQRANMLHCHGLNRAPMHGSRCLACGKQENGDGFGCAKCEMKLCGACGHRIFACNPNSKKHEHDSPLIVKRNDYRCNICRKTYRKGQADFYCSSCDWDCCINCYYS